MKLTPMQYPHPEWGEITVDLSQSNRSYHDGKTVLSASQLKALVRSPAHYQSSLTAHHETTDAMRRGTAFHALMEGERVFYQRYVEEPDHKIDKRTKDGKAEYAAFCADHAGQIILSHQDWADVHGMVASIMAIPALAELLEMPAYREASVYWQEGDIACRCRPDWWSPELDLVIDYKTCQDVREAPFAWDVRKYRYELAAAHYLSGIPVSNFAWLAVESNPPYAAMLYLQPRSTFNPWFQQRQELLATLSQCRQRNVWPTVHGDAGVIRALPLRAGVN